MVEIKLATEYGGCLDCATPEQVSQQLWALHVGLVKGDASAKHNVLRHNSFEAWRRLVEPIIEDKALVRKDFSFGVTNPRHAKSVADLDTALSEWETTKRLFVESDGVLLAPDLEHLALIDMLPAEVNTYVTMHMDMPEYDAPRVVQALCPQVCRCARSEELRNRG